MIDTVTKKVIEDVLSADKLILLSSRLNLQNGMVLE